MRADGPYFDLLESAVLAIAAERNDKLIRDIFQNERWHLALVERSPKAGRDPFKTIPDDCDIEVSYSGLAMLWCMAAYEALTFDLVRAARHSGGGLIDVGPLFLGTEWMLNLAETLCKDDGDWPTSRHRSNENQSGEPYEIIIGSSTARSVGYCCMKSPTCIIETGPTCSRPKWCSRRRMPMNSLPGGSSRIPPSASDREFRILSVGVAVAWLLLFEPVGGDPSHQR